MTHVPYDDALLKNLNGKVAIITGSPPPKTIKRGKAGPRALARRLSKYSSMPELKSSLPM